MKKIHGNHLCFLALCAAVKTSAFTVQGPGGPDTLNKESYSPSFSYLGSLGGGGAPPPTDPMTMMSSTTTEQEQQTVNNVKNVSENKDIPLSPLSFATSPDGTVSSSIGSSSSSPLNGEAAPKENDSAENTVSSLFSSSTFSSSASSSPAAASSASSVIDRLLNGDDSSITPPRSDNKPSVQMRSSAPPTKQNLPRVSDARLAFRQPRTSAPSAPSQNILNTKPMWTKTTPLTVQGGSLKTWSYTSPAVRRVQVVLKTEGRPLNADIQLWQGPDNTPQKMKVYVEDGCMRSFNAVIETPKSPNTVAIRNTGQLEFPLDAYVLADTTESVHYGALSVTPKPENHSPSRPPLSSGGGISNVNADKNAELDYELPRIIQGGALRTYPFEPNVQSVQVVLKTDGRPLRAKIELLQGPNNNKQVIEVYTEDGKERPFFAVIDTPGTGNVVRVVNAGTVEFPMTAWVAPHTMGSEYDASEPVIGGDSDDFMMWGGGLGGRQW